MGIDPGCSGLQLKSSSTMVASPGFRRIQQGLPDPAGATVRRHGEILDPGSLPEPYGDDVEIDSREPNDRLVVIRHQNNRPIIRDGCLEAISRDIRRPVSRSYAGSGEKPFVGIGEGAPFTWPLPAGSCGALFGPLAQSRMESADVVVIRRRKARRLSPPPFVGARFPDARGLLASRIQAQVQ
jgi:hypothetical protein